MKTKFQKAISYIACFMGAIVVAWIVYSVAAYKFHIYQKKYGSQMTVVDWLFDSK